MMRRLPDFCKQARVRTPSATQKCMTRTAGLLACIAIGCGNQGPKSPNWEASMVSIRILASTFCLLASSAAFADDPLPRAKPEDVGLSSERLARIGETLKADIAAGRIPGAVIAIARHGKMVA